ncbi:MAG: efflux RND transporter periplasmic adaptor subunit [Candidatus Azambacteria bacterium]|nr:efflux RND transporter periplasmic adaptor subunit [Candidatus Azambacteria bacterium]
MSKFFATIKKHKIASAIAIIILIGAVYYWFNSSKANSAPARYVTSAVAKGTLTTFVSSSGQVSSSNQVDLNAKVSGNIIKVLIGGGQQVKAGEVIAQIDATDAYKAVRDASANLQSAQLSLDKLKQAADANSIQQAKNTVAAAQTSLDKLKLSQPIDAQNAQNGLQTAQNNSAKAYNDAFTAISNSFLNSPNIISALNDVLTSEQISASEISLSRGQLNTDALFNATYYTDQSRIKSYEIIADTDYAAARKAYDADYGDFKSASVYSDASTIENLLTETLEALKAMAQAIKSENNYLAAWSDARSLRNSTIFTQVTTYKTNLSAYSGQTNTSLSNLSSAQAAVQSYKEAVAAANNQIKTLAQNQPLDLAAAENSLSEKQSALSKLMAGADPLDIKSQELSLQQRRNALYDAQAALADYSIKAPFDGVAAKVNVKAGDSASGAAIATIITEQRISEISLNEVDMAKIKVGQPVTLAFDAIDGLSIAGKVAEIDSLGAVSQGVVTYNVKIVFDSQDSRIKSGMSVNATVITNVKTDVLLVPNSAVKTDDNGGSYVQSLDAAGQPQNVPVQIGLVNDTDTEITGGLNEGDKIITQTIASGAAANSQPSGAGGGNFRRTGN